MYAWISDIQEFQHIGGTMKRVMLAIVLIVGAGFLPLLAQTTSTSILGTVTDASGAVVPGAKVTALQVGTGLKREEVTSNTGDYSFAPGWEFTDLTVMAVEGPFPAME